VVINSISFSLSLSQRRDGPRQLRDHDDDDDDHDDDVFTSGAARSADARSVQCMCERALTVFF